MNLTLVSADLVHRSGSFGEESKKEIQNRSRIEESEAKSTSKRKENSRTLTLDQPQNQEQRTPGELTSLGRRRSPACGAEQAAAARHCACAHGGAALQNRGAARGHLDGRALTLRRARAPARQPRQRRRLPWRRPPPASPSLREPLAQIRKKGKDVGRKERRAARRR